LTAVSREEITKVVETYPKEKRHSLAILQDIQRRFGYIPREGLEILSDYLDIKTAALYSMATFYRALSLKAKGRHIIKICEGTACHIRGAPVLLDALRRSLGIDAGDTAADGFFTVETVNCLGACAIGPVMVVDDQYYAKVRPDEVEGILQTWRGKVHG